MCNRVTIFDISINFVKNLNLKLYEKSRPNAFASSDNAHFLRI